MYVYRHTFIHTYELAVMITHACMACMDACVHACIRACIPTNIYLHTYIHA